MDILFHDEVLLLPGRHHKIYFLCILFILTFHSIVQADVAGFIARNVRFSGQSSLYGELYDIQGIQPRRDPSTSRFSLRSTLYFTPSFSMAADILASTESSYARQDMNFMGLHPQWTWGRAHAGDYSESFSPLSYSGINVRGGFVNIYPQKIRFALGGGQTHRAVDGNVIHQAYAQHLISSKFGYGSEYGSFLDVIFTHVKDDVASLTRPDTFDFMVINPDTLETELDTIWVEPPYNPISLTPQENSLVGINSKTLLFDKRLELHVEGFASLYTKDITAEKMSAGDFDTSPVIRNLFTTLFSPNQSSNMDFAYHTGLKYKVNKSSFGATYRYIGPGYVSLALPSFVNDRQQLTLNSNLSHKNHRLRMIYNRLSDNLLGQKQATNTRNQFRFSLNTNNDRWRSNVNASVLKMGNDAHHDSLDWHYDHYTLSTHQALIFDQLSTIRQIGVQYTFQSSLKNMVDNDQESQYHTLNLTGEIRLSSSLRGTLVAGLSHRESANQASYNTQVYSVRVAHAAFSNKLLSTLFSSSSMIRDNRLVRTGITSNYRLTQKNQIIFTLYYNDFRGTKTYHEFRTSLMLTHQL